VKLTCAPEAYSEEDIDSETEYYGLIGVLLPDGWMAKSASYSGYADGNMQLNDRIPLALELDYPAASGYRWWGFLADKTIQIDPDDTDIKFEVKLTLKAGDKSGEYQLKYIAGASEEKEIKSDSLYWGTVNDTAPLLKVK